MKSYFRPFLIVSLLAVLAAPPSFAAGSGNSPWTPTPSPFADAAPADEITLTGVIERRVAIGGETTGWTLRDAEGKRVDLLLPIQAFANLREGAHVVVKGKTGVKKYPERGEVTVFFVREIHEIVN